MLLLRTSRGVDPGIPLLRSLGSNAHVWLPGANGVSVASLPSNNYLLSDGSTGYSTVDGVDGLVKDAMDPVTGINLTQATTANKPLVRRGAYNELKYSQDLTNAAWLKAGVTATATQLAAAGAIAYAYQDLTALGASTYVLWADVSAGTNSFVNLFAQGTATYWAAAIFDVTNGVVGETRNGAGSGVSVVSSSISLVSAGVYRCVLIFNATSNAIYPSIGLAPAATGNTFTANFGEVSGVTVGRTLNVIRSQLERSTTAGDYTPTTTVAASNPSAGKYWWGFDGSNDSLLSGNLGITNACTIVIAGRVNSLAATQVLFAEATNGVQVSIATDGSVSFAKVGDAALVATAAGVVVAGVPFVLTARLSAGTADIRKNGAQSATAASATVFAAVTGARIGTAFDGTTSPTGGALGWVVPLPVALSDADCLTVERLVGQQFPGMSTVDGDANAMLLEDGSGFLTMETGDLLLLE